MGMYVVYAPKIAKCVIKIKSEVCESINNPICYKTQVLIL